MYAYYNVIVIYIQTVSLELFFLTNHQNKCNNIQVYDRENMFHKIHTHSEFQSVILFSNGFFIAAIVFTV